MLLCNENMHQRALDELLRHESSVVQDWPRGSGKTTWIANYAFNNSHLKIVVISPNYYLSTSLHAMIDGMVSEKSYGCVTLTNHEPNNLDRWHAISISSKPGHIRSTHSAQWGRFETPADVNKLWPDIDVLLIDDYKSLGDFYIINRATGEKQINPKYDMSTKSLIALATSDGDLKRGNPWYVPGDNSVINCQVAGHE